MGSTEQFDDGDTNTWDKCVASLEDYPPARAVLDSVPELREALRTVRSRTASAVGYWLADFPGVGDHSGSVSVLIRQYRRQLERAARPKAPRAETSNNHVHEFKRSEGEMIRATVAQFRGKRQLHLRTWFRGRDGAIRATTRGIAIAPELLPELEAAVAALRAASEADGSETGYRA